MSSAPPVLDTLPMTLPRLAEKKRLGEPIVMVSREASAGTLTLEGIVDMRLLLVCRVDAL